MLHTCLIEDYTNGPRLSYNSLFRTFKNFFLFFINARTVSAQLHILLMPLSRLVLLGISGLRRELLPLRMIGSDNLHDLFILTRKVNNTFKVTILSVCVYLRI
ncbi:hypothetical protein HZS_4368 [Henneguya salminicola]|nr:hypothetical protein HZS_4368 [Henneguya salminicola]